MHYTDEDIAMKKAVIRGTRKCLNKQKSNLDYKISFKRAGVAEVGPE